MNRFVGNVFSIYVKKVWNYKIPYLNFIMWGEQVCSHFSFCINSPKVQHVLPGRTYLNFISGGVLNFIPGGNMTDHIVFFFVSMEEIVCEYSTWLSQKMIRMIHTWTEHETDLKPGWEHCFVSIQIYWRCILSWKQVEFLFFCHESANCEVFRLVI